MTTTNPAAVEGMLERVARAIFCADCNFGYNIRLTSLVDGVSEYTLTYTDGDAPMVFASHGDAVEHTEMRRNQMRARAALEAMREPTAEMRSIGGCDTGWAWRKMINAALAHSPHHSTPEGE